MIREEIKKLIQKAIQKARQEKKLAEFKIPEILIEHPEEKIYGDYATNITMQITKAAKKNPVEIADILASGLQVLGSKIFEKIEVVKPGFINFFISKDYLQKQIEEIIKKGDRFGQLNIGKNKKIQVEFISANPTGPLHVGNGRGAFFGDCLANVLEKAGYKVMREYYINDAEASRQVMSIRDTTSTVVNQDLLRDFPGGLPYDSEYLREKISTLKSTDNIIFAIQKDNRDFIENKLRIKFDNWISEEKDLYKKGKIDEIKKLFKKKNLIYEKDGAEWLKTSECGDMKDWVVVRKTGEPTYLLSDAAYHKNKFERGFEKIINIWGADHQGHIAKIKAVARMLEFKGDLEVLISQMVRLKRGKLSKRKGEIITLESLIDEVGLDAARFFYLMKSLDTQMEFDIELAKERSAKSPVYYVQYAHARIFSILKNVPDFRLRIRGGDYELLDHQSELNLIKQLIRFPEIIEDTARDYQVQRIPKYAIDLAATFHQFYRDCKVLAEKENLREARLILTLATKQVLKNTLDLMGISAPEKM